MLSVVGSDFLGLCRHCCDSGGDFEGWIWWRPWGGGCASVGDDYLTCDRRRNIAAHTDCHGFHWTARVALTMGPGAVGPLDSSGAYRDRDRRIELSPIL